MLSCLRVARRRRADRRDRLAGIVEGDGRDRACAGKAVAGQHAVIMTVSGQGETGVAAGIARVEQPRSVIELVGT